MLRRRGRGSAVAAAATWRDDPPLLGDADPPRVRRDRRGHATNVLTPLLHLGRIARGGIDALPLRVAVRAGPHGADRRDDAPRALGGLDPRALHCRERESHLGVAEDWAANRLRGTRGLPSWCGGDRRSRSARSAGSTGRWSGWRR